MNDRFRYRAWDKINKVMYTGLPHSNAGTNELDSFSQVLKHPMVYDVMQCANVKCDGVLVFEEDYLSDGKTIWRVRYSKIMTGFCAEAVAGHISSGGKIFSLYHLCNRHNEGRQVDVVGNKYEYTGALSDLLSMEFA
ncbi:MAG: hypothetical protein ACRC3H_05265 [Lachnospiraceae bacterium]